MSLPDTWRPFHQNVHDSQHVLQTVTTTNSST